MNLINLSQLTGTEGRRRFVIFTFSLIKYGENKLWGREKAKRIREQILEYFYASNQDILQIDFIGIDVIDFSFAAEGLVVLITRLSGELKGKHIVFTNMKPLVKENVGVALEKAGLCALVKEGKDSWSLIGKCSDILKETFDALLETKTADTPKLAELTNSNLHSINNRLKDLMSLGLVKRTRINAPSGGTQYVYHSIV